MSDGRHMRCCRAFCGTRREICLIAGIMPSEAKRWPRRENGG